MRDRSNIKAEYEVLIQTEELLEMFPEMKGDWKSDKKEFSRYYEMNEEILNLDVNYELEDGDNQFYED
jgi:hypothetical protein